MEESHVVSIYAGMCAHGCTKASFLLRILPRCVAAASCLSLGRNKKHSSRASTPGVAPRQSADSITVGAEISICSVGAQDVPYSSANGDAPFSRNRILMARHFRNAPASQTSAHPDAFRAAALDCLLYRDGGSEYSHQYQRDIFVCCWSVTRRLTMNFRHASSCLRWSLVAGRWSLVAGRWSRRECRVCLRVASDKSWPAIRVLPTRFEVLEQNTRKSSTRSAPTSLTFTLTVRGAIELIRQAVRMLAPGCGAHRKAGLDETKSDAIHRNMHASPFVGQCLCQSDDFRLLRYSIAFVWIVTGVGAAGRRGIVRAPLGISPGRSGGEGLS